MKNIIRDDRVRLMQSKLFSEHPYLRKFQDHISRIFNSVIILNITYLFTEKVLYKTMIENKNN